MKTKPTSTVYLSNLSYERDKKGILKLVSRHAEPGRITIIIDPKTGESRGMAFIEMKSVEDATKVINGLKGQIIDGRTLKANYGTPLKPMKEKEKDEAPEKKPKSKPGFKEVQLAKKKRNLERKNANPLVFKAKTKKKS